MGYTPKKFGIAGTGTAADADASRKEIRSSQYVSLSLLSNAAAKRLLSSA